jgi:S1-C subfamily serine protease
MNTEGPEERISRLLRELADEQERRLPPVDLGPFERNTLLRQIKPPRAESRPGISLWDFWRSRFRLSIAFAATAAVVLLATIFFLFNGPWKPPSDGTGGRMQLALQWPAAPPFDPSARKAWRLPETPLPKGLPDFTYSTGTLGAAQDDRHARWPLATVIVRAEEGFGSGALISAEGWILTSYQVVAEAAQKAAVEGLPAKVQVITACLTEGRLQPREPALTATLYRADPRLGLALLKLDGLPEGSNQMPCFRLADGMQDGQDCFVVGSQPNGPAWWIRSGNIKRRLDYPQGLSQFAAGVADDTVRLERMRTIIWVSDTEVSAGDAGGPLLNAQGELMGLTFVPAGKPTASSTGWHVALETLRGFVAELPSRPEGVPLDPWTAGLPRSVLLDPELADGDGDGRIDSLRYRHVSASQESSSAAVSQPLALTVFVDLAQRAKRADDPLDRVPAGLWGMEERGGFHFDLFLMTRADGLTAVGYANRQRLVDEIRIGRSREGTTRILWHRDQNGRWQSSTPAAATPLVDATRLGAKNLRRLQSITGGMLTAPTQRIVPDQQGPRPGGGPGGQGPDKMKPSP